MSDGPGWQSDQATSPKHTDRPRTSEAATRWQWTIEGSSLVWTDGGRRCVLHDGKGEGVKKTARSPSLPRADRAERWRLGTTLKRWESACDLAKVLRAVISFSGSWRHESSAGQGSPSSEYAGYVKLRCRLRSHLVSMTPPRLGALTQTEVCKKPRFPRLYGILIYDMSLWHSFAADSVGGRR